MSKKTAIVIGAGIVGLATTRALASRGYQVTVIERNQRAVGASIRNFGMIWPIGQPDGEMYDRALLSRRIWLETAAEAGLFHDRVGSLHLAYHKDELEVLSQLASIYEHRDYQLIGPTEAVQKDDSVVPNGLLGALYSPEEIIANPRQAIGKLPSWLTEKYGVQFIWGVAVTDIIFPVVHGGGETYRADEIYVCTGEDFETLYPSEFNTLPLTKCKLQMMKMPAPAGGKRMGPAICGGLSLLHYHSFKASPALAGLRTRIEEGFQKYLDLGIHVMVSQNDAGELIVGDSHEYGMTHDPFIRSDINDLILQYLKTFARFDDERIIETWHGVYPKLTDGRNSVVLSPEDGVTIINGLGGAGMTLSFGLCEQVIANK